MTGLLVVAVIALVVSQFRLGGRVNALERQLRRLAERADGRVAAPVVPEARVVRDVAPVERPIASVVTTSFPIETPATEAVRIEAPTVEPGPPPPAPPGIPPAPAKPVRPPRPPISFEALVGGKLPIWIGGAALVLAAFFLVRYSIENGLLGPLARTILAGLFGLTLIVASEFARRIPATRGDPRVGQALAGAGIAILYGTLYIAAALYHLIGAGPAFVLMILVTLAALGLALRHGPPTAIMALIGGFSAPIIAGFDAAGVGPLLVYLALLVAALFGLAIRRGWVWLALAACGGGFMWANILIIAVGRNDLAGVGGFVLLLALGATLALPATGTSKPWLRALPLVAGLLQLLVLAPALDFGPLAWGLYLLLSAAALVLAWRDDALVPAACAALVLVLALLGVSLGQDAQGMGARETGGVAAVAITLVFAVPGHLLARRSGLWATIALLGTAGPVIVALALAPALVSVAGWAALLLLAGVACAALSWRDRDAASATIRFVPALAGGAGTAALLVGLAANEAIPVPWRWPVWLALGIALAGWSRRSGDASIGRIALAPAVVTGLAVLSNVERLGPYAASVATAAPTPPLADLVALGLLPVLALAATAWLLADPILKRGLNWAALLLGLAFVPAVLPAGWHAAGLGLATAILILWRPFAGASVAAGIATLLFAAGPIAQLLSTAGGSILGDRLPYRLLPPLADTLRALTLPGALIAAALYRRPPLDPRWRMGAVTVLAAIALATLYAVAKTPLAIATLPRFETLGFLERAIITHLVFAAGFVLRQRHPRVARALTLVALARFVWFDLLLLNPVLVAQSVGTLPLANLATLDAALAAAWLWPDRADRRWRILMLSLVLVTVAATVRQATHGALLTGPVGRTENWLYSAAMLGLAIVWLARSVRVASDDLRIAGLALLTAVTLKVFLIDAAALEGILRILSFLGLGLALIGIGWAYTRFLAPQPKSLA